MKKLDFWRADWFLGVLVALIVPALSSRDLVQSLERKAYDLGLQAASREPLKDMHVKDGEQMARALRLCLQSLSAGRAATGYSAPAAPATSS